MSKKAIIILLFIAFNHPSLTAQKSPCSDPKFRAFDFWQGEWNVFSKNEKKAGESKISLILDSCTILEEWTSANSQNGIVYKGKSFNTYNLASKQWQQTWVDNTGNTTEYLRGEATEGQIIFYADKVISASGKPFLRKLTFTKITDFKIRQLGERSDDDGKTWTTEYDLEYRKK